MARKPRGTYVKGSEPWTLEGLKPSTFHMRMAAEEKRGEADGPAHRARQRALEIAAGASDDEVEVGEVEEAPALVEVPVAPAAPEPVEALTTRAAEKVEASEPPQFRPAMILSAPAEPPPPAVAGATVNVTLRSRPDQHNRLRRMSFDTRRPIQDLVSTAVDEYLSRSGY